MKEANLGRVKTGRKEGRRVGQEGRKSGKEGKKGVGGGGGEGGGLQYYVSEILLALLQTVSHPGCIRAAFLTLLPLLFLFLPPSFLSSPFLPPLPCSLSLTISFLTPFPSLHSLPYSPFLLFTPSLPLSSLLSYLYHYSPFAPFLPSLALPSILGKTRGIETCGGLKRFLRSQFLGLELKTPSSLSMCLLSLYLRSRHCGKWDPLLYLVLL